MRNPALTVLALAGLSWSFTLSGSLAVSGSEMPLVGAVVSIPQRPALAPVLSDAQGKFLLTDAIVTGVTGPAGHGLSVRIHAGALTVSGLDAGSVRIEEFGLDGRLLARRHAQAAAGELRLDGAIKGMRVVRVSQGEHRGQWLLSGLEGGAVSGGSGQAAGIAVRSLAMDTLQVVRPGMDTLRVALPAGAGETTNVLSAPLFLAPRTKGRQRFVPGGTVLMGDEALPEARPLIRRTVAAFWMDTLVATRRELAAMGVKQGKADSLPAELNWNQAVRYCNARSLAEGLVPAYRLLPDTVFWAAEEGASGYRLPTEAEWELAARAGTSTPWYWGEDTAIGTVGNYALYTLNCKGFPITVGAKLPNPLGLYDMVGNSGQWTEDYYGPYAKDETQPIAQPQSFGVHRVWRGGSWYAKLDELRSGARFHDMGVANAYIGVRCVRTAEPVEPIRPWAGLPVAGGARLVPGGSFRMGDPLQDSAQPVSRRTVGALWVDTALVSQGQLKSLVGSAGTWNDSLPSSHNRFDAIRYCNARSLRDGLEPAYSLVGDSGMWVADPARSGWRLPSEAEWEYLARAGSTEGWWWGEDSSINAMAPRAWWAGNTFGSSKVSGLKQANGFGLRDMVGNSWQWTDDFYAPYRADGAFGPSLLLPMGDQRPGYLQVVRGGAWYTEALRLRSGFRRAESPYSPSYVSFRCVRTANPDSLRPWKALPVSGGMRRIPGGTVRLGDSTQAEARPSNLRTVRSLWVDTVLVSQGEFERTSGLSGYAADSSRPVWAHWYKAVRYCNARSVRDGLEPCYVLSADSLSWSADTSRSGYRLPSEAEWEYLARAGTTTSWWWGSDSAANAMIPCAWWTRNTAGSNQPSGLKRGNGFGLYDMVGNARQWTEDLYGTYRADGGQPTPLLVSGQPHRVFRGGAWFMAADDLRSGRREHDMGIGGSYTGFRCVRRAD